MADQQLVDYIKKAREAGQADQQTRTLLQKNGWTDAEVSDAISALGQQAQSQPTQAQPQPAVQASQPVQQQARPQVQTQVQISRQPEVQAQPAMQQQARPQMQQVRRERKGHPILGVFAALIILLIIGAGGVAYALYSGMYNPSWNPFAPDQQKIIDSMLANLSAVKSYHGQTTGKITIKSGDENNLITISSENDSDLTDSINPRTNLSFVATASTNSSEAPAMSVDLNAVVIGKTFYAKINKFVAPSTLSAADLDISKFTGKWIKFDQESAQALVSAGQAPVNIDNLSLPTLLSIKNLFSLDKQLENQTINGQEMYHYLMKVDKEGLKTALNNALASDTTGFASAIANNFVDNVGAINFEIWVGKKDLMLYEFKLEKSIPQGTIKLQSVYSNYNKPVAIQEPAGDIIKAETIILPLAKIQKISDDLAAIAGKAESINSTEESFASLCYKGLLNGYNKTYGADLINLNSDIIASGGQKVACFASATSYCVSTKLEDGTFVCQGSFDDDTAPGITTIQGTTQCLSSSTNCK